MICRELSAILYSSYDTLRRHLPKETSVHGCLHNYTELHKEKCLKNDKNNKTKENMSLPTLNVT